MGQGVRPTTTSTTLGPTSEVSQVIPPTHKLLEPYGFFVATDEFNALRRKVTVALLAGLPGVVVCGTKGRGRTAAARAIAQLAFRDTAVHGNCVLRSLPRNSNERQSAQTFLDILNGLKGGIRSLSPSSAMVEQALLRSLAVRASSTRLRALCLSFDVKPTYPLGLPARSTT